VTPAEKTSLDDLALEALVLWDQPPGAASEGEGASEPLATCAAPRSVLSQGTDLSSVLRARRADPCSLRGAAPPAAPAPDAEGEATPAPASEAEQQPAGRPPCKEYKHLFAVRNEEVRLRGVRQRLSLAQAMSRTAAGVLTRGLTPPAPQVLSDYKTRKSLPASCVVVEPFLCRFLREHQRQGVQFMWDNLNGLTDSGGFGCVLADDMGLGKTFQSITILWTLLTQGREGKPTVTRAAVRATPPASECKARVACCGCAQRLTCAQEAPQCFGPCH